jgi:hypothetical protein
VPAQGAGLDDAVVTKLTSEGDTAWVRTWGTPEADYVTSLAVDGDGNAIAAGYTGGDLSSPSAGKADAFVTSLSPDGTVRWTAQWGTRGADYVNGIAVAADGSLFAAGHTEGDLSGTNRGTPLADAFVTKLDRQGQLLWSRQWGTAAQDVATSIAPLSDGGVIVAGYTAGALLPGTPNAGYDDAFVSRIAPDGELLWSKQWGSAALEEAIAVAVNAEGEIFAAGFTYGDLQGVNAGITDAFVTKLARDGSLLWTRQWGTRMNDRISGVAVDREGSVFAGGYSQGSWEAPEALVNVDDAFVTKVLSDGSLSWTERWGTPAYEAVSSVSLNATGQLFAGGYTLGHRLDSSSSLGGAFVVKFSSDTLQ